MKLYPLQFEPILKERIWGGTKLRDFLNKPISSAITGESWEISTVGNDVSVIANGNFKGQNLNQLINNHPEAILGKKVVARYGKQFPLLFKYLDAQKDLSIQVHPNDDLAKKRHNSFGKTEMWYVMQADPDAELIVGFKEKSSKEKYVKHLENKSLVSILDVKKVKKGDVFFLNTGTIHALGAGILIAEIQQTSDITYRLYDFDRLDANGKARELHVDLALDAINYDVVSSERNYLTEKNKSSEIVSCRYFVTNFIHLDGKKTVPQDLFTFKVFMCVEGAFELVLGNEKYSYGVGDTILIPAKMESFSLIGQANILEIYI
jgi:mannose-6-phosphate isomerase